MVAATFPGSGQAMRDNDTAGPDPRPEPTIDEIFRRLVARRPDDIALVDCADKPRVTGERARRLTFAEADRAVAAIAEQLGHGGLTAGSVVALQMANTVEFPLALLAILRAGMVAAPLPQLWRQADLVDALNRIGARGFVCAGTIDGIDHGGIAMSAAAEVFSIRHVCGFGANIPDGVTPLDIDAAATSPRSSPFEGDARRAAIVTFDLTAHGRRAVPRNHAQLIAGALAISLECGHAAGGAILSTLAPSSFATLGATFVMWLLRGATLVLHQPFDEDVLKATLRDEAIDTLVVPAPVAARLADGGLLADAAALRAVIGLWRNPEQVAASAPWAGPSAMTDVYAFGEIGLFAARRMPDGRPAPITTGPHGAPRASNRAPIVGEALLTPEGRLALRGPMVPLIAYAATGHAGGERDRGEPIFADTGYGARVDRATGTLQLTNPPAGIVNVGGYRFLDRDLQALARNLDETAVLTSLPDRFNGHRLGARAGDNRRARAALAELGLNPLVVDAFRDGTPQA